MTMEIELHKIKVRDLIKDYKNHPVDGVSGYGGKLDIRPKYQREFVYKDKQRDAVMETVKKGFPLNTMYWAVNVDEDGSESYEVLDGQQRTISLGDFINIDGRTAVFSVPDENGNSQYFHNIVASNPELAEKILDYELQVYFCKGTEKEKLDWFKVINIAGEQLSDQELRNAVYTGSWLADAKSFFSKKNGAGENLGKKYLKGDFVRQAYLETAIKWINKGNIEGYMATHQNDANAELLKEHFKSVISWVDKTFPISQQTWNKYMKGLDWGDLYSRYGKTKLDSTKLEEEIATLMEDEDVTKKSGIFEYVLSRDENILNIRNFDDKMKTEAFARQKGICPRCHKNKKYKIEEMEADHVAPWSKGGKTNAQNCQMLCKEHNRRKSSK